MQYLCKAVGKYKEKFQTTGILLVVDGQDRWVDMPGQLNWKQYKEKNVDVNMTQNDKGYWSGTFSGGQPQQGSSQPAQSSGYVEDTEGKVRHGVVCAAIQSGQLQCQTYEAALECVRFIMTGETTPF